MLVQFGLNVVQKTNNWVPNFELFLAQTSIFTPIHLNTFSSSWTHVTVTYNLTGMWLSGHPFLSFIFFLLPSLTTFSTILTVRKDLSVYYNGTLAGHVASIGNPLRWTDTSGLFLGGYIVPVSSSILLKQYFVYSSSFSPSFPLCSKQVILNWFQELNRIIFMDGWMI